MELPLCCQSDQYTQSSNTDTLKGWCRAEDFSLMILGAVPSKLTDPMILSVASTQYNLSDTRSRVIPLGHITLSVTNTDLALPSMPDFSILGKFPQLDQNSQPCAGYTAIERGFSRSLSITSVLWPSCRLVTEMVCLARLLQSISMPSPALIAPLTSFRCEVLLPSSASYIPLL